MNIVLIGYRGTGKTAVGKLLAEKLQLKYVSTDDGIIKKAEMKIPDIVEKQGWDKFRDIEEEVVKELSEMDNMVIDCGGGVILRENNVKNLKNNGKVFLLKADIKVIVERIKDDSERPALKGASFIDEIEEVLKEREPKYDKAKDFEIDSTNLNIDKVVEEILKKIKGD